MSSRSVAEEIRHLDRQLAKLTGLINDPQAQQQANRLLEQRLELMADRARGFRVNDRRRIR